MEDLRPMNEHVYEEGKDDPEKDLRFIPCNICERPESDPMHITYEKHNKDLRYRGEDRL